MADRAPEITSARIAASRRLIYDAGADPQADRPAHVRAGSGCCFLAGTRTLAIAQDDAHFLALVDVDSGSTRALALPAGPGGQRQFDVSRGNKQLKLDLEACLFHDGQVILLGSGSTPARQRAFFIDPVSGAVETRELAAIYAALRAHPLLAGAELNIEGAVLLSPTVLRLFQRGNGRGAIDATFDVPWPLAPRVLDARRWVLGAVAGVPLSFADATRVDAGIVFLAAAENSPDAVDDGEVMGCAIGLLEDPVRAVRLPYHGKPEGIAADPDRSGVFWLVVDADDPDAPAELLELHTSAESGPDRPRR